MTQPLSITYLTPDEGSYIEVTSKAERIVEMLMDGIDVDMVNKQYAITITIREIE